jgi:signal transduction histidine kinase
MILPFNLDLFLSGFSIAAALILGFVVFIRNRQSVTNIFFLAFTIVSSLWIAFNYLTILKAGPELTLWLIRIVMFWAIYQAFFFFLLMHVFPESAFQIPRWWRIFLTPVVIIVSCLTLSPIVFSDINVSGPTPQPMPGPGIIFFALTAVSLVVGGIVTMIRKTLSASGIIRTQFKFVSIGVFSMFALIITFNFVLTAAFGNTSFIPFSSTFALPFIILTTYAIVKHQLLNIKIIGTEILTFLLVTVTFFEVLLAASFGEIVFRSGVFLALLIFSIFLIRSMRHEVEQREKLEELTRQLAQANEALKELDHLKDEFVSIASHELRTPMTAIRSYLWMALYKSTRPLDNKVRDYLDIAFKSTDRLIKLVQDLLTISRIEGKRLLLNFETLDLYLLAKQIYKELKISASQKKVKLLLEPQETVLNAKVD